MQRTPSISMRRSDLTCGHARLRRQSITACRRRCFTMQRASSSAGATAEGERAVGTSSTTVIVGGGPAGLATALMLRARGWKDVTIIERLSHLDLEDSSKMYSYAIDGRGRKATDLLGLTEHILPLSVEFAEVTRLPVKGELKTTKMVIKDTSQRLGFLPRRSLLQLMLRAVESAGGIKVVSGATCTAVERDPASGMLRVTATVDGAPVTYEPSLLVGADGVQSVVRQALHSLDPSGRFEMHKLPSPAAGLRIKVAVIPHDAPWNHEGTLTLPNHQAIIAEGLNKMRLGMLPFRDPTSARTANFILKPEHPFWSIGSTSEFYEFLEASFPQLPIRRLISEEQAERIMKSPGVTFPRPQSCDALHMLLRSPAAPSASSSSPSSGPSDQASSSTGSAASASEQQQRVQAVVLVGDALHCFPPDLGQGVNSALEDISILNQILAETGDRLDVALPLFEQRRMPDIKALIRLMTFSYPYQYNQDDVGRSIWFANFLFRMALNKVLPSLVAPPSFIMVQDPTLSYSQIVQRADDTTRMLTAAAGVAGVAAAAAAVSQLL